MTRLGIVANSVTPYRIHLHRRIVRECPDLELWSVFTHEFSNAPWKLGVPEEIRPLFFGAGEDSEGQGIANNPWHEIRKARQIEQGLQERKIDAIILFGYNDWGRLHIIRWCRKNAVPCFVFGDSNPQCETVTGLKRQIKGAFLPRVLQLCNGAMYCGRMGAEYFRNYGVPEEKLFPFPYEPDYDQVANARADSSLPPGRRRIVYSGRLAPIKRVDLLISAFQTIAHRRPDWDLAIAGDGPDRPALQAQIDPALADRVSFLGFINDPGELARVYAVSDVLVLPSDCEPWGVVVTEAATRLALVCSSRVGAGHDLLQDRVNGRVFPAGDAAGLAEALDDVTGAANIDRMKSASPLVLAAWRSATDPVQGLRSALRSSGLPVGLPSPVQ